MKSFGNGEDLKVLYVNSGYLTEDDKCGYDERVFVVRKSWIAEWYNKYCADYIRDKVNLDEWLNDYYTGNEAYNVYIDAKQADEIVCEQNVWKDKAIFYEVWEESIEKGESETRTLIRTESLWSAEKVFEKAKADALTNSVLSVNPENIQENFKNYEEGEARLWYDGGSYSYGLYLTKREVELEDWKNA